MRVRDTLGTATEKSVKQVWAFVGKHLQRGIEFRSYDSESTCSDENSGAGVPGVVGADAAVGVPISASPIFFFFFQPEIYRRKLTQKKKKKTNKLDILKEILFHFFKFEDNFFFFGFFVERGRDEGVELHNWEVFINACLRNRGREGTQV